MANPERGPSMPGRKGRARTRGERLLAFAVGPTALAYMRRRKSERDRFGGRPEGEYRWDAGGSDWIQKGPGDLRTEHVTDLLSKPEFRNAVRALRHSYEVQPLLTQPPINRDDTTGTRSA